MIIALLLVALAPGCDSTENEDEEPQESSIPNLAHLDHLGQDVTLNGVTYRIVHIYSEAPDYGWVGDDDEGIACVDDAARAAVVYLRHFEITQDETSRQKAEALLRFIMYMQTQDGLFFNFVLDPDLTINQTHPNSRADAFEWWAARGVWALGTGARALKTASPSFSQACERRVRRSLPHLEVMLSKYGQTVQRGGRSLPTWLLHEYASDATSELLLGLSALYQAYPNPDLKTMIDQFAEGLGRMQYGSMAAFPYGAHASWLDTWHAWGNAQTQALAEAGFTPGAVHEAEHFYPHLLIDGWRHHMNLNNSEDRQVYPQIAYDIRPAAVGLIRLYEKTNDERYAVMAGLAASWFTGNNPAGVPVYNHEKGYGHDGISGPNDVNYNAGAESTIEALYTILEVEHVPAARKWLHARGEKPVRISKNGSEYAYRVFNAAANTERIALVMNLTDEHLELLEGSELDAFIQ